MTNQLTPSLRHFLINVIKPYKQLLSIMALIGLFWALINTFMPYMLKLIIDHVVDFKGNKTDLFKTTEPYIYGYIALWIALCLNMRLLDWVKLKLFPNVREAVMSKMFKYLNQHSHHYFQNNFSGSLINKITDMQSGVIDIFMNLDDIYAQTLGLSVAIITLLFIHPIFSAILLGWAFAFLLITFLFLKPIQQLSHVFAESKTSAVGKMVDSISNIINVRLFVRHADENRYINQSIKDAVQKDRTMQTKIIKMRIFWDISIIVLMSLNLFILLHMYGENKVSIGDFAFVISLSITILWNLWFIAGQFVSFSEQIGICKQALSIVSLPHEIVDVPDAKPLIISKGKIKFHNVTFHYDEGAHLFKNKNIVIEPSQKVGLVGFSGSGKSTFVNLILRLFEVESGEITIDDQNINQVTQKSLREQIALIPQDITLFHRTLMENIRFGNTHATDAEVFEIAKKAHCHEFIIQLSQGYDSMVGERGIKLSTGQRQRIAIARAMLKNAPILILDEATSALDSITEKYTQDALQILMQDKTTIVIAHRLSTLSKMDRILVFDNGQIIEDGTHEALIAKAGHYARMWQMQAGGFLPETEDENKGT
ncbi:MAG: ABC transporter ATP-binding protein [Gammaproteobacteria bacterium]|nr:ABC transporter ATP-binding protein [Gammaproteobacteria bacterium]